MKKAALLAAGEGSRLKKIFSCKPIAKINGIPLLELTYSNLRLHNFTDVCIILNAEHESTELSSLEIFQKKEVRAIYKVTQSSMHSLYEVTKILKIADQEHFFCSMVDSIVLPKDADDFHEFCKTLAPNESAIMVTPFVEDEAPLTLSADSSGVVQAFQVPLSTDALITSGVYYFSSDVLFYLNRAICEGKTKMRNFLSDLVGSGHIIKVFKVQKTIDIDRPEDITSAEEFLTGDLP